MCLSIIIEFVHLKLFSSTQFQRLKDHVTLKMEIQKSYVVFSSCVNCLEIIDMREL